MAESTKIEVSFNKIRRINGLDDLARLLFPQNKAHQKVFLAMFLELKYAPDQFLPSFTFLCEQYQFSPRLLEKVRAKCRRMGIFDHVSRFNSKHGYREGWVFSNRFGSALKKLNDIFDEYHKSGDLARKEKDYDCLGYV
jgi:hypothetical protein